MNRVPESKDPYTSRRTERRVVLPVPPCPGSKRFGSVALCSRQHRTVMPRSCDFFSSGLNISFVILSAGTRFVFLNRVPESKDPYISRTGGPAFDLAGTTNTAEYPILRVLCEGATSHAAPVFDFAKISSHRQQRSRPCKKTQGRGHPAFPRCCTLGSTNCSDILRQCRCEYLNMAKAHITKGNAKITVEGTPEEVAAVVALVQGEGARSSSEKHSRPKRDGGKTQKATPINLISSLIDGGFFRKPKDLGATKVALEELGHFYPVTTLSPALLRLVRRRQLRRLKDQKRWLYTG